MIFRFNLDYFSSIGEKTIILTAVGNEIRRYIPNAKDFEYNDIVMSGRRIQAVDIDPIKKLVRNSYLCARFSFSVLNSSNSRTDSHLVEI